MKKFKIGNSEWITVFCVRVEEIYFCYFFLLNWKFRVDCGVQHVGKRETTVENVVGLDLNSGTVRLWFSYTLYLYFVSSFIQIVGNMVGVFYVLGSFWHDAVKRPMHFLWKLLNFYDLCTFVAKFCRENLRTFSPDFFGLKSKICRYFSFMDVWGISM